MDSTQRAVARLSGAVLLVFGLGIGALCSFAAWRMFAMGRAAPHALGGFFGLALLGFFCIVVGCRLVLARPNRRQSLLPPWGWYAFAAVFAALGVVFCVALLRKAPYDALGALAGIGMLVAGCLRAGRIAARGGMAGALPGAQTGAVSGPPRGLRIGMIGQAPLYVHWSFLIGGLLVSALSGFKLLESLYYCLLYTLLIALHECGHIAAAHVLKLRLLRIEIDGFGGRCFIEAPRGSRATVILFCAGLLVQAAALVLTILLLASLGPPTTPFLRCAVTTFTYVNAVVMIVNSIPAKVDGFATDGRILLQVILHVWKGHAPPFPGKSTLLPRETRLHRVERFPMPGFTTGIEILNDDTTPMQFVVDMLVQHLDIEREQAMEMMLKIHRDGGLLVPLDGLERSVAVAAAIAAAVRDNGHQLICRVVDARQPK